MNIPGMVTLHRTISDECRKERTTMGAIEYVVEQVRHELGAIYDGWPIGLGVKVHIFVSVERPGVLDAGDTA